MSDVEDHSELPDFLPVQTLAEICVKLCKERQEYIDQPGDHVDKVVRLEKLHNYYFQSLRSKVDLCEAHRLINNVE